MIKPCNCTQKLYLPIQLIPVSAGPADLGYRFDTTRRCRTKNIWNTQFGSSSGGGTLSIRMNKTLHSDRADNQRRWVLYTKDSGLKPSRSNQSTFKLQGFTARLTLTSLIVTSLNIRGMIFHAFISAKFASYVSQLPAEPKTYIKASRSASVKHHS